MLIRAGPMSLRAGRRCRSRQGGGRMNLAGLVVIKWFIGAVVAGVGINLLSGSVMAQQWAWLPSAVFAAALLIAVPSTGLLRRERYRTTRASRWLCSR